jgi:hypothetical protein
MSVSWPNSFRPVRNSDQRWNTLEAGKLLGLLAVLCTVLFERFYMSPGACNPCRVPGYAGDADAL